MTFKRGTKTLIALLVVVMISVSACGNDIAPMKNSNPADAQNTLALINNADTLFAKKALFTWGDKWEIYADGQHVANVKGEAVYLIGDTYSMFTLNGTRIGAETENLTVISNEATVYDSNMEKSGTISQEILHLLYHFKIYENTEMVGTVSQNFSVKFDADIKNVSGTTEWNITRKMFSFSPEMTITRKTDNPNVSGMNALWMSLILNEISSSSNSKNNS